MEERAVTVDANGFAEESAPKTTSVSWTLPIDRRLDQLVELARASGAERSELLAALVRSAEPNPEKLERLVKQWKDATVREVVLGVPASARTVDLPVVGPGRRGRRRGG